MKNIVLILCLMTGVMLQSQSFANTVRANAISAEMLNKFMNGEEGDLTVEFKSGDRLPVIFTAEGDFLESAETKTSYWNVKKDLYLRISSSGVLMSLDGNTFKPFNQIMNGSLTTGALPVNNSTINAINLHLIAYLK